MTKIKKKLSNEPQPAIAKPHVSGSIENLMKENGWYIEEYSNIEGKYRRRMFLQAPKARWVHCEVDKKTFDDLKRRNIITNVLCDCQPKYYKYTWWLTDLSYYR